jgi:hypothetical protein
MSAIETDTESRLRDARYRGRRRVAVRRGVAAATIVAAIAIVTIAAPRILDLTERRHQPATIPTLPTDTASEEIWGTWTSQYTCPRFVRGFERAGISEMAARWLVNFGLQKDPLQAANVRDPCQGAKRFPRTHTFEPSGMILTRQGHRVADHCRCFELLHRHVFVVLGGNGHPIATLRYSIDAGTLTFEAATPNHCSSVCRGHFAWAVGNYAITTWHRET